MLFSVGVDIPETVFESAELAKTIYSIAHIALESAAVGIESCEAMREAWSNDALSIRQGCDQLLKIIEQAMKQALNLGGDKCLQEHLACSGELSDIYFDLGDLWQLVNNLREEANTELRDATHYNCRNFGVSTGILDPFLGVGSVIRSIGRNEVRARMEGLKGKLVGYLLAFNKLMGELKDLQRPDGCPDPNRCHKRGQSCRRGVEVVGYLSGPLGPQILLRKCKRARGWRVMP